MDLIYVSVLYVNGKYKKNIKKKYTALFEIGLSYTCIPSNGIRAYYQPSQYLASNYLLTLSRFSLQSKLKKIFTTHYLCARFAWNNLWISVWKRFLWSSWALKKYTTLKQLLVGGSMRASFLFFLFIKEITKDSYQTFR